MKTLSYIKSPDETVIYNIDFTDFFDSVSHNLSGTPTVTATTGVTVDDSEVASGNKSVNVTLSGGTADEIYSVTCVADTDGGETFEESLFIICKDEPAGAQNGYTTVARVALELNITDETEQNLLAYYIDEATQQIKNFCNRDFGRETDIVEKIQGNDTYFLSVAKMPLTSIASITYEGTAIAASNYEVWDAGQGLIRRDDKPFEKSPDNDRYVVTYTAGYVLPGSAGANLPADIEKACVLLVKDAWQSRNREMEVASERVDGVYQVTYAQGANGSTGVPGKVQAMLRPYRKWNI